MLADVAHRVVHRVAYSSFVKEQEGALISGLNVQPPLDLFPTFFCQLVEKATSIDSALFHQQLSTNKNTSQPPLQTQDMTCVWTYQCDYLLNVIQSTACRYRGVLSDAPSLLRYFSDKRPFYFGLSSCRHRILFRQSRVTSFQFSAEKQAGAHIPVLCHHVLHVKEPVKNPTRHTIEGNARGKCSTYQEAAVISLSHGMRRRGLTIYHRIVRRQILARWLSLGGPNQRQLSSSFPSLPSQKICNLAFSPLPVESRPHMVF